MTGDDFPHGENRGYQRGCRCDDCRAAHSAYNIRRRRARAATPPELIPHGTSGYSNYGCRCPVCSEAQRQRVIRYWKKRLSGWRAAS